MPHKTIIIHLKSVAWRLLSVLASFEVAICLIAKPFLYKMRKRKTIPTFKRSTMKRVLVIRPDEIGDVVMNTPFLRELRHNLPDAEITLLVKPVAYNLMELCPYVNEVLTFECTRWHTWKLQYFIQSFQFARRHLWMQGFDIAIMPRWDTDHSSATFLSYFSGTPLRLGYSEKVNVDKKQLNRSFDRLLTHVLQDSSLKHEVEHNLDVIRFLGGKVKDDKLELWYAEKEVSFANDLLRNKGVESNDLLVAICPGAGAPKRQWPLPFYIELCQWLQKEYHARLIIIGGPGEEILGEELQRELGTSIINVVGKVTLRQMAALVKQCSFYVGNDTGPMHIAAALDIPIVELSCHPTTGSPFSSNSPRRFGPWKVKHVIVQPVHPTRPCLNECIAFKSHCIREITVGYVKEAITEQIFN